MKSTTYAITGNPPGQVRTGFAGRWGGLPLLVLVMTAGLPLRYKLEPARQVWIEEVSSNTLDQLSGGQSFNSLPYTLFIAAVYLLSVFVILTRPQTTVSMVRRHWPIAALLFLGAASVLWTYNPEKVILSVLHTAGEVAIALAAALCYKNNPWQLPRHLGIAMGLNMMVQLGSVFVIPNMAIDYYGRWIGLTMQPNTLGLLGLFTVWANMAVLICRRTPGLNWLHGLFALLGVAAMVGADSVTSMACAAITVVALWILSRTDAAGNPRPRLFIATILAVIAVIAISLLLMADALNVNKLFGLAGRTGDFSGRTEIWAAGLKAFFQQPLFGWSFDDNAWVIKMTNMPYTSFHNGYLDIALRGGLVAVVLFIALMVNWSRDLKLPTRMGREIIAVSVSFVLAMLIHNMTEAWLVGPRNHLWTVFMTLLFLGACKRWTAAPVSNPAPQYTHYRSLN